LETGEARGRENAIVGQVLIQTIDRGVDARCCRLYVGILKALCKTVLKVAQLNNQALDDLSHAALADGCGCG
jgi:hypothetical protein